ncbi:MAG: hypothetical protein M0006_09105 [Magnetospirillum sp.]|nr:hypothetical protein [Magnetospirillum sp.]
MKRVLLLTTGPKREATFVEDALAGNDGVTVERQPLPDADAPPSAWDAVVAAMLTADVILRE